MEMTRGGGSARHVAAARARVERWRGTHRAYSRMPEDLWADAVAVAEAQGAYCASRELGVNYATLKRRTEREVHKAASARFVEVDAATLLGVGSGAGTVVELASADGAKLTMRLGGAEAVNLVALAQVLWSRGA